MIKTPGKPIESSKRDVAVVQEALAARTPYLNSKQQSQIKHYWAIVYEGAQLGKRRHAVASFLEQPVTTLTTWFSETKTLENLEQEVIRSRQILAKLRRLGYGKRGAKATIALARQRADPTGLTPAFPRP